MHVNEESYQLEKTEAHCLSINYPELMIPSPSTVQVHTLDINCVMLDTMRNIEREELGQYNYMMVEGSRMRGHLEVILV